MEAKYLKTDVILGAFNVLSNAKYTDCQSDEKIAIVRACIAMRPIVEEYNKSLREAEIRLRPENFDEIQEKSKNWDSLSNTEKLRINKISMTYNEDILKVMEPEISKEHSINIASFNDESIGRLFDSNPNWNVRQAECVMQLLG